VLDRVALGCGNFGGIGSAPELFGRAGEDDEQAFAVMDAAWDLGIRWFDTADAYGGGRSESAIGKWIAATGNRPRITTKTFNPMDSGEDSGLAPDRVRRQIRTSLERLGVEHVDFYLAHAPDETVPFAETARAFEELVGGGLVGAWGVSNFDAALLGDALKTGRPDLLQNSYSLLDRGDEEELLPLCAEHGIAYQAFSPLAGGWLTGKYRRGQDVPAGSRMTLRPEPYRGFENDRVYDSIEALERAAADRGVSSAGLALAWLLSHPQGIAIVIGPRNSSHLDPVREAVTLELSPAERDQIGGLFG
jgi:aryl-alcohol dehydrogenase-like predicted oxidoreductase